MEGFEMTVETRGTVRMRGDPVPPTHVDVEAGSGRLRLVAGSRLIGDWELSAIGVRALMEGFAIRVEGEDLLLFTEDDPAVAEALGLDAASPRLARLMAAAHRPGERLLLPEAADETADADVAALVFAVSGVLIVLGGVLLRTSADLAPPGRAIGGGLGPEGRYWLGFLLVGLISVAVAYGLARATRWVRWLALATVMASIVVLGLTASTETAAGDHLLAYGFIAGGVVASVAVLFSSPFDRSG